MEYPEEDPNEESGADRMAQNRDELAEAVVGHRIMSAEKTTVKVSFYSQPALVLTLDSGRRVEIVDTDDCCAYTELGSFLLAPELVDHVIMGVGTTEEFETWHIYADAGDVLKLAVGWSGGNLGYYGYGFDIRVTEVGA